MARWGKSIVVPLESLIKEKENTNRPIAARSAGTVGKWGKMGFTSTRTYGFKAFSTITPIETSENIDNQGTQSNEPPKPKKFFKSRNSSVEVIRTQIIQHLPRAPPSPIREVSPRKDPAIKIKLPKLTPERKKSMSTSSEKATKPPKPKKKKEEKKKLKPEAPPSRVLPRQRKTINYNEEDEDDDRLLSARNAASSSALLDKESKLTHENQFESNLKSDDKEKEEASPSSMEPPATIPKQVNIEHPPIVLRISKGTSRLISSDSDEMVGSPVQQLLPVEQQPVIASTEELLSVLTGEPVVATTNADEVKEDQSVNVSPILNSNVVESEIEPKVSPNIEEISKKESLKIVIKTDVLKSAFISEKQEKKGKNKKHKKGVTRQPQKLSPMPAPVENRTLMSPPPSEKDFDSQSSILGSISSKETNQFTTVIPEDSCVIRSRGSSDVTSDLETSQHSSLVAPPSDIESRLESMMDCDDDIPPLAVVESRSFTNTQNKEISIQEEPLKEDILEILTGGEEKTSASTDKIQKNNIETKVVKTPNKEKASLQAGGEETVRRVTRSRRGNSSVDVTPEKTTSTEETTPVKVGRITRNNSNGNIKNNASLLPPARSYTRKRKNAAALTEQKNDEIHSIDHPDALVAKTKDDKNINENTSEDNTNKILNTPESAEKEYKIKNKFKRTWYERNSKKVHEENENLSSEGPATKKFNKSNNVENLNSSNNNSSIGRLRSSRVINNNHNENGDAREDSPSGLDDEKRSVKLVISKKKGSIFKSRALVSDQGGDIGNKKRAIYKHTWDDENKKEKSVANTPTQSDGGDTVFEDDFNEGSSIPKFSRFTKQNVGKFEDENVTSVKCDRKAKEYYTVVRNVKTAHQIQEIGEYQEMKDDVDYILDALQPHNPISTRCLSALQLATKCMTPGFRMHVRAHGTVAKFFKALKDAKNDLSLSLCTATIMFVLSQDTLNIDLDRDSLELMMSLLEAEKNATDEDNVTFDKNKQKVRELCEEIKSQGKASHLILDSISAGTLAFETLLSLTSKKAGEWFKEELRELGGLEHIIKTVCECCYQISDYVVSWTEILLDKLKTIERCLRVLENVSQLNEKNQDYILTYNNGHAVDTLFKLYKLCDSEIALYPTNDSTPKENPGVVLREALVPTLKVLINLTHPFDQSAIGSALLGQRAGVFDTSFHILLQAPNYVPERCIFELSILVLLLLINLTMYTIPNRTLIMKSHAPSDFGNQFVKVPAIKALIEYFYRCQEQALLAEQNTDEILENPESNKKKPQSQEEMDETVTKLLQKAGHHMEHTLQASYAGILIGHLISESSENEETIRSYLKENKFQDIVDVLEKYYTFMNLTASSEATVVSHIKSTKNLIDYFKKCDAHSICEDNDNLNQQQNINNSKNNNSGNIDGPSSLGSSISTRSSTTRYYKSYSQR